VENLDRVANYIREEFEQTSGRVSEQVFQVDGHTYRNVILQFGPESGARIVIGAHYDTHGEYPGADDNASGVAGLIELAHLLDQATLETPVELVAYSLEELPYFGTENMGSAVHAQKLRDGNVPVKLMVSLEMIGYYSDEKGSQHYPYDWLKYFYPTKGNYVMIVGKLDGTGDVRRVKSAMSSATDLAVYSINVSSEILPDIERSDHLNYWKQGYSAVMVTDTAFLRNKNYHSENDTLEKLDYDSMAKVVVGVYEAVLRLAE
jgi:Zn-dependent M28 family amino/carboxypeptidase